MTPPYHRALVRARDLATFRRALVALAVEGSVDAIRRRIVIVPTRAAAELLRQSIEQDATAAGRPCVVLPDLATRADWLARLHAALPSALAMLTPVERHVIFERAARETMTRRGAARPAFDLRPGLVGAMLDFYDELKRRQHPVRRFARALFDELRGVRGTDRGSDSLVDETAFLGLAFLAYERARDASGRLDEHVLRDRLIATQPALPFDHVVLAVADHPADRSGLWPADFSLLGRLTGIARLDVVLTDEAHDAGFRDRIEHELPGIVETRAPATERRAPRLVVTKPATGEAPLVQVSRDREEEVREVARAVRTEAEGHGGELREPVAVVFHRPLPYLYLAQQVFADAGVPFQAFDALPLAVEPYAALLDLVLTFARTGGTRDAAVALLRSPLVGFEIDRAVVSLSDVSALDETLIDRRASGTAETFPDEVAAAARGDNRRARATAAAATRAARAAATIQGALEPFREARAASAQVAALATFLRAYERKPDVSASWASRHFRARAAVLAALDGLADAFRRHDDRARGLEALSGLIHHAIEAQTFAPRRGHAGVHLVDAAAARFGEFAHVHLVGLVDSEWPEPPPRHFFYTTSLLATLGWPQTADHARAQQAAFRDLLSLARDTTRLSGFTLEGDAIVGVSPFVELARDRETLPVDAPARRALFADERDAWLPVAPAVAAAGSDRAVWLALRAARPPLASDAYSGMVAPRPPEVYRVSKVERYVACPFKYFAESVLRLGREPSDEAGLTPLERGTRLHQLFEQFYAAWDADGHGAITADTLPEAADRFAAIAHEALASLPDADRALEETRLFGSIVARGVAERVFELEADAGIGVEARLIEQELAGPFVFPIKHGLDQRTIEIKGKADRIDILADGTLRVVDYKLSKAPDMNWTVQIAVYAHCARAVVERERGGTHPVSSAAYLAFGDDRDLESDLRRAGAASVDQAVTARASEFAGVVAEIEAGHFPANPKRVQDCAWCEFAGVCRKEYRSREDDDEAAEPV